MNLLLAIEIEYKTASVHWYKKNQRNKIISTTNRLTIIDLSANDTGLYECQFHFKYGISKAMFNLRFDNNQTVDIQVVGDSTNNSLKIICLAGER